MFEYHCTMTDISELQVYVHVMSVKKCFVQMATKRNSSTSSAKCQLVFSKYHRSKPCGTCALCGKSDGYYSHFGGWGEGEKAFVVKHLGHELPFDACICSGDHA